MRRPARPALLARVAAVACAALVVAGCGAGSDAAEVTSSAPTDRTLELAFLQDPGQPPDPDVFYAGQGLVLQENVYEGLLQYEPGTATPTIAPSLATAWEVSPDGLTYTLTLRGGVTFHDGTPFDSSAVAASFDRRTAVGQGPAYMVAGVTVEAPAPDTVVLTLPAPDAAFLSYLASPYGPRMMSPALLAEHEGGDAAQEWLSTHDAGTGPYTLTKASVGQEYQLQAYDGYWGDEPYFTTVDIPVVNDPSALQVQFNQGGLHAILGGLDASATKAYQDSENATSYALPALRTAQVYLNPSKGYLEDRANRQATLEAIDIDKILSTVYPGRADPPAGNYPAEMLPDGTSPQEITHDTGPLAAIVEDLPADERSITVGFDSSETDLQTTANLIAADLNALGFTTQVQALTTSAIFGFVGADATEAPEVLVAGAWPDSAEAYTWAHIIYDGDGGLNYLGCSDPALTQAIADAAATSSEEDPALWGEIGEQALATGCWANTAYLKDFMVGQTWLTGVEEAHVVTAPTSLLLARLGVEGASS